MGAIGGEELPEVAGGRGEKILVSVRLRPLSEKEAARNDVSEWECISDNTIICRNNLAASERSMYPSAYTFDRVFRPDSSTRQVYEEGAKEVALSVVSGINSSIFAYGQTSSGKTYTMSGITEYTVADIYDYIDKHMDREFFLKFCALEIYNESVRDLLSADSTPLRLLDDPERGTTVERLTEETLRDWNHFKELMSICEAQRQIGETSLNEASSRSHQILRLTIESSAREFLGNDKSSSLAATVNFVDLAGSERASQTLSAGTRLKEGCHINRSLLTLGTVIRKLSKGRNGHVPYRDSKLTRILQSSLGGNARTAIICTLSPARSHIEQSRNTLLFASCANEVSTNARVNVVMSDKALVKQLKRELARLENELKTGGTITASCDSASILKEKELQIEKLKKEIAEVTHQRDLAQSQVKDLLRVVEDDKQLVLVDVDQYYPKLKVHNSWDIGNQTPGQVIMTGFNSIANSVRSYDTYQNSDGFSRSSSHENFLQLADDDEDFLHTDSSQQLSVGSATPDFVKINLPQEETDEQPDKNLDDVCKDVRCIEMEEPNTKTNLISRMSDSSQDKHANSNVSYPHVNTIAYGLIVVENGQSTNEELMSNPPKKEKTQNTVQTSFLVPSPEKPSQWLMEKDLSGLTCMTLTRSRSCKARVTTSLSSGWFENIDNYESTPPIILEKSFTGRPEGLRNNLPSFKFDNEVASLSTNDVQTSENDAADELNAQNVNSSIDSKGTNISISAAKKLANLDSDKSLADSVIPETEIESKPAKSVKDVGLDPIQSKVESPANWPSEFKRLQREIIELWHSCNVSLVHRTYFFQLFKGDPSDSIYMEVELRRLSFLKEIFSRGNQTVEDGRTLTLASSVKALSRERHMLAKQMQKRLTKNERENIFLKWGIGLNTKHRRLQLVQRLWSGTKDIDHVTDSAIIVSKLVGEEVPEQAFKEMFGLKFTARRQSRKSFGLKRSMMSLV